MNKKEWHSGAVDKTFKWKRLVQQKIKEWKISNNITEKCDIHHRDDTEECIKYNEEHYELWGFNEDGTFEYGKYVVFMTHAEHSYYHHHGEKHHMYGRKGTDNPLFGRSCAEETKRKISESNTGRKRTDEVRYKMSISAKNRPPISDETRKKLSEVHKGRVCSDETREKIRLGNIGHGLGEHRSEDVKAQISSSLKNSAKLKAIRLLYRIYKDNNGIMSWNDFKHALKTGDITFVERPIEVIINDGSKA